MPQADSQYGNFACEMADQFDAYSGLVRRARPGRNHNALRPESLDLCNRNLIITAHFNLCAQLPKILDQVVSKGIVVVENENHRSSFRLSLESKSDPSFEEDTRFSPLPMLPRKHSFKLPITATIGHQVSPAKLHT
jgi:hypothetical protein